MMTAASLFSRRVLGVALGLGLAATLGITAAFAQDATPEAPPSTEDEATQRAPDAEAVAEAIATVDEVITAVQADRDAVADQADMATVDQLLAQATSLRDQAQSAADGGDAATAIGNASAAIATAQAAENLIHAQLADYGLPSQQASASRVLVDAFYTVEELTNQSETDTSVDVSFYVTTAQALYTAAYEQYNNGLYAQAAQTAMVASDVARVANVLYAVSQGDVAFGFWSGGGFAVPAEGRGGIGRGIRGDVRGEVVVIGPRGGFGRVPGGSGQDQPVTVPEPNF